MRISLHHFAAIAIAVGWMMGVNGTERTAHAEDASVSPEVQPLKGENATNPVADPVADSSAVVTMGNARFTVLTPELIRMEWSA